MARFGSFRNFFGTAGDAGPADRQWARALLVALVAAALAGSALAQAPKKTAGGNRKGEPYHGRATIVSAGSSQLKVKTKDDEELTVKITSRTELQVVGPATDACLQPGQCVMFNAAVSKKLKKIRDAVKKLTLFSPTRELALGLIPDPGGTVPPIETAEDQEADWKPYIVGGQIVAADEKQLVLTVPDFLPRFKLSLSSKPKIDVNLDDPSVARAGDTIDLQQALRDGDTVYLAKGRIKLSQPLEKPGKAPKTLEKPRGTRHASY